MTTTILTGDCRAILPTLAPSSARCCVTSPPYWNLRSYGMGAERGEIGTEATPDAYVAALVAVFREVRRVLTDDGTLCSVAVRTGTIVLFVGPAATRKPGVTFGDGWTTSPNALRFYASIRIEGRDIGHGVIRARIVKNKFAPPFVSVDVAP